MACETIVSQDLDTLSGPIDSFKCNRDLISDVYDVEFIIPSNQRTYRVTEILIDVPESKRVKHHYSEEPFCRRTILSFKVDGVGQPYEQPLVFKK